MQLMAASMGGRSRLTSSTGDDGNALDVGSVDDDSIFMSSDYFTLVGQIQCDPNPPCQIIIAIVGRRFSTF